MYILGGGVGTQTARDGLDYKWTPSSECFVMTMTSARGQHSIKKVQNE